MLACFPFAPNVPSESHRVVPRLSPLAGAKAGLDRWELTLSRFSPGAQDRLTLGQMLFAQETYPASDPKDYRLGNCYFHQDL